MGVIETFVVVLSKCQDLKAGWHIYFAQTLLEIPAKCQALQSTRQCRAVEALIKIVTKRKDLQPTRQLAPHPIYPAELHCRHRYPVVKFLIESLTKFQTQKA